VTVVIFGVEQGILLAVVLSLLMHVRQSYRPHIGVVVRDDADHWRIENPVPGKQAEPGMVMFWFGAGLFYANVAYFAEQARKLVHLSPSPVRWLVLDARAVTELDFSAGRALTELHEDLKTDGVVFAMIVTTLKHQDDLERMGLDKLIGEHHIFESRYDCVQAYRSESVKPDKSNSTATPIPHHS
jgi:MFS superfamily sulfate permease-like transporter